MHRPNMAEEAIVDCVIKKINDKIGEDVKDLQNVQYVIRDYKEQFNDIESKLDMNCDEPKSQIRDILKQTKNALNVIEVEDHKAKQYIETLDKRISYANEVTNHVSSFKERIRKLKQLLNYVKIMNDIKNIHLEFQSAFNENKSESFIKDIYLSLCGNNSDSYNSVIGRLENQDTKLKDYAIKCAVYWHKIIMEKFSSEFETVLKNIEWCQYGPSFGHLSTRRDQIERLVSLAECIFVVNSPLPESMEEWTNITPTIMFPPICKPIQLMLKAYRQKFLYHFTGNRKTNRLDKPEWYFTQIINWAKEGGDFINKNLQIAALNAGLKNLNVKLEFIRGLIQLGIEKLVIDIEEISKDGCLFAHLIDEILLFESEISDEFDYPNDYPSLISVLVQPKYLLMWIETEKRFCTNQMDLLLQNENAWNLIEPSNCEEIKIPYCADQFIYLLDALRNRYSYLNQPGHKLQFLNLQLELIDNYRRSLVQLHSSRTVIDTKILNAIHYIVSVLREWGENLYYLHLHAPFVNLDHDTVDSVFEQPINELEHWQQKLLKEISMHIVSNIKAKASSYCHENWSTIEEQSTKQLFILTPSAGQMFQLMVTEFHNLDKELSAKLLEKLLRLIAYQLDEFFFYTLVMNVKFSNGGAMQFQYDMTRNLFPIFGQYVKRPNVLFKRIHDVCILLNIPLGNGLLLYQTLKDNIPNEDKVKAVRELGILFLNPDLCIEILEKKTNFGIF